MESFTSVADRDRIENEMPWEDRDMPVDLYKLLCQTADQFGARPAIGFQLFSDPKAPAKILTWRETHNEVTQLANLLRDLGIGPTDTVAFVLPNTAETPIALLAAATAGIVAPVNPLLDPQKIASILRATNAHVVVTLRSFPKVDIADKVNQALTEAPDVAHVIEIDMLGYLTGVKRVLVPFIRPGNKPKHDAKVHSYRRAIKPYPSDRLTFHDPAEDRVAAYFHTGGTTGEPKLAQHRFSGIMYNAWLGKTLIATETDVLMCPLPMFHVFAAYPTFLTCLASGALAVFPTPAGYRGEGVFDNFWKLIERWQATFLITVPTAISALMQRPPDADVSSLRSAMSGSAALPLEVYQRFKEATGVEITEGYGLTEATCLVSCNPLEGLKKVGSVGITMPYTHVRILETDKDGGYVEMGPDEVGEICVSSPGIFEGSTYTDVDKNHKLFHEKRFLRTGDLGRLDADGYLWITGRAKDLIIRGGHNIDPAVIEDALSTHPSVAFVGAIGQPDSFAGEIPCAYVELVAGATTTVEELTAHVRAHIDERAAVPKYIEIMPELPKTAVGKIFKPDLRKLATARVYREALKKAGSDATVAGVIDDKKRGMVVQLYRGPNTDEEAVLHLLGNYTRPWEWVDRNT